MSRRNDQCQSRNQPDYVSTRGSKRTELYFRPGGATPPDDWDVCVPHRSRSGWVVYIKYIVILAIFACIIFACFEALGISLVGSAMALP